MTRPRYPGDWPYHGARARAEVPLAKQLAGVPLTDEDQAAIDALPAPRKEKKRPVQHESNDVRTLYDWACTQWWGPVGDGRMRGWRRWEAKTSYRTQAWGNAKEGVESGMPDCGLVIPARRQVGDWRLGLSVPPTRAVLELKAEYAKTRECSEREWWLAWKVPPARWDSGKRKWIWRTKAGLTGLQALVLQDYALSGYQTAVCHGVDEAIAQLKAWAGPRPDVLPEGWG